MGTPCAFRTFLGHFDTTPYKWLTSEVNKNIPVFPLNCSLACYNCWDAIHYADRDEVFCGSAHQKFARSDG